MFRRITVLVCALAFLAGALSWTAAAAPITGSFTVDITFYPENNGFFTDGDDDGDTLVNEDPWDGSDNDGDTLIDEDPPADAINKIDRVRVKFEADLVLTLSISGLELTSTTAFTFKGVEVQIFYAKATVGAMTFENALVFAPNILEIEEVRSGSGTRFYCLRRSAPIDYSGDLFNGCTLGSSSGIFHPVYGYTTWGELTFLGYPNQTGAVGNLILGTWADGQLDWFHVGVPDAGVTGSMLDQPLTFRKKAAEVTLSIAGLTLGLRALFANFGTVTIPSFTIGTVLILAGTTVSGIQVRSETWIGARQGFECFGECKPIERLGVQNAFIFVPYPATGGIVVPGFQPEEEKLYISGLTLGGIRNQAVLEFQFGGAAADSRQPTFAAIQSTARITPLNLSIINIARFDRGFERFLRDTLIFQISVGDAGGVVYFDWRPNAIGAMEMLFQLLSVEFDPPGATASVTLISCAMDEYAGISGACNWGNLFAPGTPNPFLEVDYDVLFEVGDMTVEIFAANLGSLLKNLYILDVTATWAIGPVTISSYTSFWNLEAQRNFSFLGGFGPGVDFFDGTHLELAAQQFSVEVKF